jgi:hypothetical protein
MKRLLLILILTLSFETLAKADDVRDFEIEGMSIGDNLLDHIDTIGVTKNEILKKELFYYPKSKKFAGIAFSDRGLFKTYSLVQFTINPVTYIIEDLSGEIDITSQKDCEKKQKKIFSEISEIFKSGKKTEDAFRPHTFDKTGNSIANGLYIEAETGDQIGVECYIWGQEIQSEKKWKDNLKVNITSKKVRYFLNNEAY